MRTISPSPQVQPSSHNRGLLNTDSQASTGMPERAPSCYHAYSMGTEASIGGGSEKIGLVFKGCTILPYFELALGAMGEPCSVDRHYDFNKGGVVDITLPETEKRR